MSRICRMCGKGYLKGNLVCFSNKKTIKKSQPNLRRVKVNLFGFSQRMMICASCLQKAKKNELAEKASKVVEVAVS